MWPDAWPSLAIQNFQRRLDGLAQVVSHAEPERPDEVTQALSRFLVIRSCGYVEQVTEECIRSYLSSKSDPRSAAYGSSWLGRGANPTPGSLVALVGRFDGSWADELQALLDSDDEKLKRELSFLVDRRNKIAHGLPEGLGTSKALDLKQTAADVGDWFIKQFDPR